MRILCFLVVLASCGSANRPHQPASEPVVAQLAPAPPPQPARTQALPLIKPDVALPVLPDVCRGVDLDIAVLRRNCMVEAEVPPLPAAVSIGIEPNEIALGRGGIAKAALVLTNKSAKEVRLLLDGGCPELTTVLSNARGDRVDRGPIQCVEGGVCGAGAVEFALMPGGTARLGFEINGWTTNQKDDCSDERGRDLQRGSYTLEVRHLLGKFSVPVSVD